MEYMLSLDVDRLLAPYLHESGLPPVKASYENWENTGLDGHIGGHYLSALSNMYAATGDARMEERLNYMLEQLKKCQQNSGGYLGGTPGGRQMWEDISKGIIKSDTFALNDKWVPLYNIHKLLAGLRDSYVVAGKSKGRELLINLTNYIYRNTSALTDDQIQLMLFSEHGGLNEVFADVYSITNDEKYLRLARRFSHRMLLEQLVRHEDKLTGLHANMQIPKAVGYHRIGHLGGDANYTQASAFFWETVVKRRTVVIGGNSVQEHFNPANNFLPLMNNIAGPETCNTYNMLKLTHLLFADSGRTAYIEYYERALFNQILSSQHPTRGGFVYYTPMKPRHYRVYSQPQINMWCCVGSGMENHGKYGELIYSHNDRDVYVNLFIASRLSWHSKNLVIAQTTKFPEEASTRIVIEQVADADFSVHIRYPTWVEQGKMEVFVNKRKVHFNDQPGSYITLTRQWKQNDVIEVRVPMKLSFERMPDGSEFVAFLHGPIVLAARTDPNETDNFLGTTNQFGGYRASGRTFPLNESPQLRTADADILKYLRPVKGKAQTFVLPELIAGAQFDDLQLTPFYKLHDSRYVIYWPLSPK